MPRTDDTSQHGELQATVHCYSGHLYAQEPRRFGVAGAEHQVRRVLRAWREPSGPAFLVEDDAGVRWRLRYDEARDAWYAQRTGV